MKYSRVETLNLAAQINKEECLEDLNKLILREGCSDTMPVFKKNEVVLDMDCVEYELATTEGRTFNKSMDSAFVIVNDDGTAREIILVEFRFNYQSLKNLDKDDLLDKVSGSTNALKNTFSIHQRYIFIFNSNLKQQAINWLFRKYPRLPLSYIALDINDLKSVLFI